MQFVGKEKEHGQICDTAKQPIPSFLWEDSKATVHRLVYLNNICVCFRAWLLAVCVLVKVRKPKSVRPCSLRHNSSVSLLCASSCNVSRRLACHVWRLVPELHQNLKCMVTSWRQASNCRFLALCLNDIEAFQVCLGLGSDSANRCRMDLQFA